MMTANGLAKVIEECGELLQIAGKRLAWWSDDWHPDGHALPLRKRMEDEMADVLAAVTFHAEAQGLDLPRIQARAELKLRQFRKWHLEPDNSPGIDRRG